MTAQQRTCIGYGEFDNRKANPAKHCKNVADTPAGLWCQRCEALRRASLTEQFASITESFDRAASQREGGESR